MADDCITKFLENTKDILGRKDAKAVINEMLNRSRNFRDTEGLPDDDAINKAANQLRDEIKAEGEVRTRQQLINLNKYNDATEFIGRFKDPGRGLVSFLSGVEGSTVKGAKLSVDGAQKSWRGRLNSDFITDIDKGNLRQAFHDINNHKDVFKEMYEPGITDNKEAAEIARVLRETYGKGRDALNKRGAAIADLLEYTGRQMHSPERMLRLSDKWTDHIKAIREIRSMTQTAAERKNSIIDAGLQRWKNFILPRLDQARTFEGKDPDEFLRGAFENIVLGRYDTVKGGAFDGDFKFTGPGNLAKKVSTRRQFHFKDGQSAYEYNQTYGAETLPNVVAKTLDGMGKNVGLMERLGANPRSMFDRITKDIQQRGKEERIKVSGKVRVARNVYKELSGELRGPIDNMWAKIGMASRVTQVLSKLGSVTLSSLPDLGLKADQLRANGMGYLQSETQAFLTSVKGFVSPEERAISDLCGTYFESLPQQLAHQYSSIDTPFGAYTKLVQVSYKISGITKYDEINRRSFSTLLARHLNNVKSLGWDGLDKRLQQNFSEHGIGPEEWDLMRTPENVKAPYANKQFITPDMPREYSDASIAKYIGKPTSDLTPKEIAGVKENMEFNLRTYFMDNTDNINMLPGARERASMNQGLDPNTPAGAAWRLVSQFKGFILSMTRRKIGRFFGNSIENGFKWGDTFTMNDVQMITQLSASLWAYGYLAISMKDLIVGKSLRDPTKPKTALASLLQGGSMGIYGDFLLGEFNKSAGRSFVDSLSPSFETLDDVADLFTKLKDDDVADLFTKLKDMDHPGSAAFYLAKNNMPFINLWYAKAAYNYLFLYGIEQKLSPGSIERMKDRMNKEFGQHFLFDPDQYANKF